MKVTYPLVTTKNSRLVGENGENSDENKVLDILRKNPSITQPLIADIPDSQPEKSPDLYLRSELKRRLSALEKPKEVIWKSTTET